MSQLTRQELVVAQIERFYGSIRDLRPYWASGRWYMRRGDDWRVSSVSGSEVYREMVYGAVSADEAQRTCEAVWDCLTPVTFS